MSFDQSDARRDSWLASEYYGHLTAQIGINIAYLNQALTWSITALSAGVAFVLGRSDFPSKISIFLCAFLWVVIVHFGIRAAKGYINVMRFSTLEKHLLHYILYDHSQPAHLDTIERISLYHFNWVSPLSRQDVMAKLLFELGYIYFLGIDALIVLYAMCSAPWSTAAGAAVVLALAVSLADLSHNLLRSPYLVRTIQDDLAHKLR